MEFSEVVNKRKSVRSYTSEDVPDDLIIRILEDGHSAPTAGNVRPWEFVVVRDAANRRQIVESTYPGNREDSVKTQSWIMEAPVIIVVVCSRKMMRDKYGSKGVQKYIYLDCSACIENMLLSAVSMGLASCYISGFREAELGRRLDLPPDYEVIGLMPVGYEKGAAVGRYREPLENVIHFEKFNTLKING